MSSSCCDVLGLFPSSGTDCLGGVQSSGQEAWTGVLARVGDERAHAIRYEAGASKTRAVLNAVSFRKSRAKVVLVWHLHLLRLVALLDQPGSRLVLFLHGVEAWRKHDPLTQFLLKRVDLILSNSDFTWSRFLESNAALGRSAHLTVHLGTGSPLESPAPAPSTTPSVLMVSRLDAGEDYKGHRQMIEAWPLVVERIPGAELRIAGSGDLLPHLEQLVRERALGGSVKFYGHIPDSTRDELTMQCRALAMPSRGEGFGLVYLEAMRTGRPCLVSNADAGREIVNPPEAGLAVDPDNLVELADAVTRLMSLGREWEQWSARARARYEAEFTAGHFQRRLANALFEEIGA